MILLKQASAAARCLRGAYMSLAAIAHVQNVEDPLTRLSQRQEGAHHPYAIAFASVLVAAALRLILLQSLGITAPYVTFYPAVMLAALYGGLRAGATATVISAAVADYFLMEPVGTFLVFHASDLLSLAIFLANGVLVSWVADRLRKADAGLRRSEAAKRQELERLVAERTAELVREVAERRDAEQALRKSERRLRRIYDSGLLGLAYWNMNGQIVDANDKFLEIVGYERGDLAAGRIDWQHMTPPEFVPLDERLVAELQATGVNSAPIEKEYIRKDGSCIPVLIAGAMLDEARFDGVAFVIDISERKRAEEARRESEERMSAVMQNLTEGIIVAEAGEHVAYWNSAALAMFGYASMEECRRKLADFADTFELRDLHDGRLLPVADWPMSCVIRGEVLRDREVWLRRLDQGWEKILAFSGWLIRGVHDKTLAFVSTRDITERKEAEDALRDSEQRFRMLIDEAPDAILIWESGYNRPVITNKAAERLFGVSREEILNGDPQRFYAPSQPDGRTAEESYAEHLERARASEEVRFLRRIRRPTGEERLCQATLVLLHSKIPLLRTSFVDVTEQASAEAEVAEVRRDMSVRQEAERSAIARELHDSLGQYLAAMNIKLALLAQNGTDAESLKSGLADLTNLTSAVGSEVSHLAWELRPISLDDIGLDAAVRRLGEEWAQRSGLKFDFHVAFGDRRLPSNVETTLYRVLQEAITNVVKHARATKIGVILRASAHDAVMIVEDDGIGFDPEAVRSKAARGFGLLGIHERLTAIRGDLEIETGPGAGTTLIVRVALDDHAAAVQTNGMRSWAQNLVRRAESERPDALDRQVEERAAALAAPSSNGGRPTPSS